MHGIVRSFLKSGGILRRAGKANSLMTADVYNIITRRNIGSAKGLLQSLVPRAQCFCFYDLNRSCVWSSDGVDDYEIDNYVTDLPDDVVAGILPDSNLLRRTLTSGRTVLVLPVYGDNSDNGLGLLVSVFSKNAGKSTATNRHRTMPSFRYRHRC